MRTERVGLSTGVAHVQALSPSGVRAPGHWDRSAGDSIAESLCPANKGELTLAVEGWGPEGGQ